MKNAIIGRANNILLCGRDSGSGKTTLANCITEVLPLEEMIFSPVIKSAFGMQGFDCDLVRLLVWNDLRIHYDHFQLS